MKKNLLTLLILLVTVLHAQSDYEKVQNFKSAVKQINRSIEQVKSVEALDSLYLAINSLKTEFANDKELLDKSLYPDDFTSSIQNLENKLKSRRDNFADVGLLEAQIVSLQNQLDQLNEENTNLLNRIKEYQNVGGSNAASVNELRRMVSDLKTKLKQRDELVRSIVDSLLSDYVNHPMTLNEAEKQQIYEKVETGNLFYNIEKTVRDNLEYLKVSKFTPDELGEVKEDQVQFSQMWRRVGPRLSDLYREQGDQTGEVAYITNLFSEWEQKLDERIWDRVSQSLRDANVELQSFDNGDEFTSSLLTYIDNEKTSASEIEYKQFRDSVWIAQMKTSWLPVLVDNEMITVAQRDEMQNAIDKWGGMYETETPYYWYVLIGFILLVFILIFVPKWKSRHKPLSEQ